MSIAPYILETYSEPLGELVTVEEMQTVLRFDDAAEYELIQDDIDAAVLYVEKISGKQLLTATYDYKLPCFPGPYSRVELPRPPVSSVDSVKYYDTSGTLTTLTVNTHYTVQLGTEHAAAYVMPAYSLCWPATRGYDMDVVIRFTCGFGGAADVPQTFRKQIKLLVAHWFHNRSAIACGAQTRSQLAFDALAEFNRRQEFV